MTYKYYAISRSGLRQVRNEDRVMVDGNLIKSGELAGQAEGSLMAAVCDGVGGCGFGEKAASTAALSLLDACDRQQDPFSLSVELFKADNLVRVEQKRDARCADMKTTVAALYLDEDGFLVFNAGDTRVYRFCNGELAQLSEDHTLLKERESEGAAPTDACERAKLENIITCYLGAGRRSFKPAVAGDTHCEAATATYLICSDGAYKGISEEQLASVLSLPADIEQKARIICRLAEESCTDDISLVLIEAA